MISLSSLVCKKEKICKNKRKTIWIKSIQRVNVDLIYMIILISMKTLYETIGQLSVKSIYVNSPFSIEICKRGLEVSKRDEAGTYFPRQGTVSRLSGT